LGMFGVGYHILLLSFLAEDTSLALAYVLPKDVGRLWKAWSSTCMHVGTSIIGLRRIYSNCIFIIFLSIPGLCNANESMG